MYFEIIAAGFNGNTDETDNRIIWVKAPDATTVMAAIGKAPYQDVCQLTLRQPPDEDIDYMLPQDSLYLNNRLTVLAANLP